MKILVTLVAALIIAACSAITPKLDEHTGTTKAQRCADYQGFLAAALAVQANTPTEARAARIAYYKAFIGANCGEAQ